MSDVTGPDATGPDATGPDATGPDATGPDATGPDATGPDATGDAVVDLLGLLAYGQLVAFDRMAEDAKLAPDLNRRAALSEMAGSEIANYHRVAGRLSELGVTPEEATAPFRAALRQYHDQTVPRDWPEALTKAYVGDGIADDFIREVAQRLGEPDRGLVLDVLHDTRYEEFAAAEIRAALASDPAMANRLSIWARRLVGEAMTQAQRVTASRPAIARLLVGDSDDLSALGQLLDRLAQAHLTRMTSVGLNN